MNEKARQLIFEFAIVLRSDDKEILEKISIALDCGKVGKVNKQGAVRYSVNHINDLKAKIIPFFEKHKLYAKKRFDFQLWKEAVLIFDRNQRKKLNVEKGKDGFQRTNWDSRDLDRLKEIHKEMQVYKSGNKKWKWL